MTHPGPVSHQCQFVKMLGIDRANREQEVVLAIVNIFNLFFLFSLFVIRTLTTGNECINS